jgi:hypothetical protein
VLELSQQACLSANTPCAITQHLIQAHTRTHHARRRMCVRRRRAGSWGAEVGLVEVAAGWDDAAAVQRLLRGPEAGGRRIGQAQRGEPPPHLLRMRTLDHRTRAPATSRSGISAFWLASNTAILLSASPSQSFSSRSRSSSFLSFAGTATVVNLVSPLITSSPFFTLRFSFPENAALARQSGLSPALISRPCWM